MAEGWVRHLGSDQVQVQSAGIEAHGQNPRALAAMTEAGLDISRQESTVVTDDMIWNADIVVTVCGNADENCPVLPPGTKKLHWPLADPAKATGTEEEVMRQFREARDEIGERARALLTKLESGDEF